MKVITYVFQHSENGYWMDYATLSHNPFEFIETINDDDRLMDILTNTIKASTPTDKAWRLIKRIAEEEVIKTQLQ